MTARIADRIARLEAAQAEPAAELPMPPALYEQALRTTAQAFGGYPCDATDTLGDGLARALGYVDRASADARAEAHPASFNCKMGMLWSRLVDRYAGPPQAGPERTGDNPVFRTWCGILEGDRHYRCTERPTADLHHLPNGLPLFDYGAASVRAAFAFFGIAADDVEATHDDRQRH